MVNRCNKRKDFGGIDRIGYTKLMNIFNSACGYFSACGAEDFLIAVTPIENQVK